MNQDLFDRANECYRLKDYQGALLAFTNCLEDARSPLLPGEMGLLYHQIGNCLVKLKNPSEAIQAYTQATADPAYDATGVVQCNMGMAYVSLRDYEDAVRCYKAAIDTPGYTTPYKAYMGMGNALMKLGKSAEAGVAFREAALQENNPDPTKALLNLGVCFMALNRPADAVASYESALPFPMTAETRNRLYASLGQAYVSGGYMEKAVAAFEKAIADKTYFLSDSASVDYQRAVAAVAQGTSELTQSLPAADMSGLDVTADGDSVYPVEAEQTAMIQTPYLQQISDRDTPVQLPANDQFFDPEVSGQAVWSQSMVKKRHRIWPKVVIILLILIIGAVVAGVVLYTQGYGYPTQQTVVSEMFANPSASKSSLFLSSVSENSKDSMLAPVVTDANVTIDGVNQAMDTSTVYATAKTPEGGSVTYQITMGRDLIGWKIANIELYFPSQN